MQPKTHTAVFFVPGLCSYESDGNGIWLCKKDAIDNSINSFIGKPVQIGHNEGATASGYVCGVRFDEYRGYYVADFFLLDDNAEKMVNSGDYFPSCFYLVEEQGGGGVYNDIEYQCEILKMRFEHLAIVDTPRYSCGVFDFNSEYTSNDPNKPIFPLKAVNSGGRMASKKKTAKNESGTEEEDKKVVEEQAAAPLIEADTTAQNSTEGGEVKSVLDKVVVLPNGEEMPVKELVEKYKAKIAENEARIIDENESIDVDGESVKIKDMIELVFGKTEEAPAAPPASTEEPPPAENATEDDVEEEEEDPPPPPAPKAENSAKPRSATNGLTKMRQVAANAAGSDPTNFNARLPNESREAYNKRMNERYF